MKPEAVGMSSARLARLDEVMKRRYLDGGYLPGMLTYVYRKGHLVHTGICGHMDIERGKKMQEDAIFRIYSMSKPITAVALMMLVEEGLIGLDDAVHTHIPAWKDLGVYASGVATLLASQRDVPHHSARPADEGRRPGHPHCRTDLRLPDANECRRRLSQTEGWRLPDPWR